MEHGGEEKRSSSRVRSAGKAWWVTPGKVKPANKFAVGLSFGKPLKTPKTHGSPDGVPTPHGAVHKANQPESGTDDDTCQHTRHRNVPNAASVNLANTSRTCHKPSAPPPAAATKLAQSATPGARKHRATCAVNPVETESCSGNAALLASNLSVRRRLLVDGAGAAEPGDKGAEPQGAAAAEPPAPQGGGRDAAQAARGTPAEAPPAVTDTAAGQGGKSATGVVAAAELAVAHTGKAGKKRSKSSGRTGCPANTAGAGPAATAAVLAPQPHTEAIGAAPAAPAAPAALAKSEAAHPQLQRPRRATAQMAAQRIRHGAGAAPPDLFAAPHEVRLRMALHAAEEEQRQDAVTAAAANVLADLLGRSAAAAVTPPAAQQLAAAPAPSQAKGSRAGARAKAQLREQAQHPVGPSASPAPALTAAPKQRRASRHHAPGRQAGEAAAGPQGSAPEPSTAAAAAQPHRPAQPGVRPPPRTTLAAAVCSAASSLTLPGQVWQGSAGAEEVGSPLQPPAKRQRRFKGADPPPSQQPAAAPKAAPPPEAAGLSPAQQQGIGIGRKTGGGAGVVGEGGPADRSLAREEVGSPGSPMGKACKRSAGAANTQAGSLQGSPAANHQPLAATQVQCGNQEGPAGVRQQPPSPTQPGSQAHQELGQPLAGPQPAPQQGQPGQTPQALQLAVQAASGPPGGLKLAARTGPPSPPGLAAPSDQAGGAAPSDQAGGAAPSGTAGGAAGRALHLVNFSSPALTRPVAQAASTARTPGSAPPHRRSRPTRRILVLGTGPANTQSPSVSKLASRPAAALLPDSVPAAQQQHGSTQQEGPGAGPLPTGPMQAPAAGLPPGGGAAVSNTLAEAQPGSTGQGRQAGQPAPGAGPAAQVSPASTPQPSSPGPPSGPTQAIRGSAAAADPPSLAAACLGSGSRPMSAAALGPPPASPPGPLPSPGKPPQAPQARPPNDPPRTTLSALARRKPLAAVTNTATAQPARAAAVAAAAAVALPRTPCSPPYPTTLHGPAACSPAGGRGLTAAQQPAAAGQALPFQPAPPAGPQQGGTLLAATQPAAMSLLQQQLEPEPGAARVALGVGAVQQLLMPKDEDTGDSVQQDQGHHPAAPASQCNPPAQAALLSCAAPAAAAAAMVSIDAPGGQPVAVAGTMEEVQPAAAQQHLAGCAHQLLPHRSPPPPGEPAPEEPGQGQQQAEPPEPGAEHMLPTQQMAPESPPSQPEAQASLLPSPGALPTPQLPESHPSPDMLPATQPLHPPSSAAAAAAAQAPQPWRSSPEAAGSTTAGPASTAAHTQLPTGPAAPPRPPPHLPGLPAGSPPRGTPPDVWRDTCAAHPGSASGSQLSLRGDPLGLPLHPPAPCLSAGQRGHTARPALTPATCLTPSSQLGSGGRQAALSGGAGAATPLASAGATSHTPASALLPRGRPAGPGRALDRAGGDQLASTQPLAPSGAADTLAAIRARYQPQPLQAGLRTPAGQCLRPWDEFELPLFFEGEGCSEGQRRARQQPQWQEAADLLDFGCSSQQHHPGPDQPLAQLPEEQSGTPRLLELPAQGPVPRLSGQLPLDTDNMQQMEQQEQEEQQQPGHEQEEQQFEQQQEQGACPPEEPTLLQPPQPCVIGPAAGCKQSGVQPLGETSWHNPGSHATHPAPAGPLPAGGAARRLLAVPALKQGLVRTLGAAGGGSTCLQPSQLQPGRALQPGAAPAQGRQGLQAALALAMQVRNSAASKPRHSEAEDEWDSSQVQALTAAYHSVDPTHPRFWQEVAAQVPGRTAAECFSRMFDRHKTPEEKSRVPRPKRLAAAVAPGSESSSSDDDGDLSAAILRAQGPAPGLGRKLTLAQTLRFSREQHRSATLGRLAEAGAGADHSQLPPELLEALDNKEHTDRYITSFLRQAGGWSKWQRTCRQAHTRRVGHKLDGLMTSNQSMGTSLGNAAGLTSAINTALHEVQELDMDIDDPEHNQDLWWGDDEVDNASFA